MTMRKELRYIAYFSLLVTTITLFASLVNFGIILGIAVAIVISTTWGFFISINWKLGNTIIMLIFLLGISLAILSGNAREVSLLSLLGALSTWDIASLKHQFSTNKNIRDEKQLVRAHFVRLANVLFIGFAFTFLSFSLKLTLKFWQVSLLGILLLGGLSQVFSFLKRSSHQ
jgi:hypothetical protein